MKSNAPFAAEVSIPLENDEDVIFLSWRCDAAPYFRLQSGHFSNTFSAWLKELDG